MSTNIKKTNIIKYFTISFCVIMCLLATVAIINPLSSQKKSIASSVDIIYNKINSDLIEMSEVSPELAMSSNPYDYIKASKGYNHLIELGVEAIPYISNYITNSESGLSSYILAIAIEDIASCNVYEATGIDWATSKEFANAWDNFKSNATDNVNKIIKRNKDAEDIIEEIKPYGVLAIHAINNLEKSSNTRNLSFTNKECITKLSEYKDTFNLTSSEEKVLSNYIK